MKLVFTVLLSISLISLSAQPSEGFFNFEYDEDDGVLTLHVAEDQIGVEFLYVNSLSAGIGSNDIGLDRGQLGRDRIVKFIKTGKKLLLVQSNQDFRAVSDNAKERKAVEEAFAKSVLWGFEINKKENEVFQVDMTGFLLRDEHGVVRRLKSTKQGTYKLDKSRSAVWMDRTKSFPDNTEFDALLTFTGEPSGEWIRSVAPSSEAVTVHQHHSFIRLPDDQYKPRQFHPYSGFNQNTFFDYATPIESPIQKRFIVRHRLEKTNPEAAVSDAVEPIIYYIDPGCPEPIRSALVEGGAWWDQAFQAAGYSPGTFQVRDLPEGADMLDVRYNVIQWVHRSTRGWSYGSSIADPRTGEILKGHVSLGSLRVRQDFLIAQGLLSPYEDSDDNHGPMLALALARLRQLSAHEIGHTIGLAHNFASSVNDRASVMDYPHPLIGLDAEGNINFDDVYDIGIGEWDKHAIVYGYSDFADDVDEKEALNAIISEAQINGLHYISDRDARPRGGLHPQAHLWDNGVDAIDEFERLLSIRAIAMDKMGKNTITNGTPLSELEKLLVPIYLLHRYQLEAVSKVIGGYNYSYAVKGDELTHHVTTVSPEQQTKAIDAILSSLTPEHLVIPDNITKLIPPPAYGYNRGRETFKGRTNLAFDPMAPAESYTNTAFQFLLDRDRLSRLHRANITGQSSLALEGTLKKVVDKVFDRGLQGLQHQALNEMVQKVLFVHLIKTALDKDTDMFVSSAALNMLDYIKEAFLNADIPGLSEGHKMYLQRIHLDSQSHPNNFQLPELKTMPPGSPIGCGEHAFEHLMGSGE